MMKRVFGVATVCAVTAIVVAAFASGCTEVTIEYRDGSARDAKTEARAPNFGDSGNEVCYVETKLDASDAPYMPPRINNGACPNDVTDQVLDYVKNDANPTFQGLKQKLTQISAACGACVFTPEKDQTWGPIVEVTGGYVYNTGGCIGIKTNKPDCGKRYQQNYLCLEVACQDCTTDTEVDSCIAAVPRGACADAVAAAQQACGTEELNSAIDACFPDSDELPFLQSIKAHCVGNGDAGATDGGTDASDAADARDD